MSKLVITYGHVQAHVHQNSFVFCHNLLGEIEHGNPSCFIIFKNFSFHDVSQFGELQMDFQTFLKVLIESFK